MNNTKKRIVIERFFSWIENYKKIFSRYEVREESYRTNTISIRNDAMDNFGMGSLIVFYRISTKSLEV